MRRDQKTQLFPEYEFCPHVAVVQSSWHRELTDDMVSAFEEKLATLHSEAQSTAPTMERFIVPGCYEIPLATKKLAASGRFHAVAVFGAIVKGETDHYQVILETCIRELGRVMYEFDIPVINEIIPALRLVDVAVRCQGENNKGYEAAQALVGVMNFFHQESLHSTQTKVL